MAIHALASSHPLPPLLLLLLPSPELLHSPISCASSRSSLTHPHHHHHHPSPLAPLSRTFCQGFLRLPSHHSTSHARKATASEAESVCVKDDGSSAMAMEPNMPSSVVKRFYESINNRRLDDIHDLVAENCVYEDLVFTNPFKGRKAVLAFFKKFMDSLSQDLKFVIDDISKDDSAVVAVAWHLEWRGRHFPFSKGCSFYRCDFVDGKTQIVYGRDCVEPAAKPGDFALVAIGAVTALLERFPLLADRF